MCQLYALLNEKDANSRVMDLASRSIHDMQYLDTYALCIMCMQNPIQYIILGMYKHRPAGANWYRAGLFGRAAAWRLRSSCAC